jgi:hypothetical protein
MVTNWGPVSKKPYRSQISPVCDRPVGVQHVREEARVSATVFERIAEITGQAHEWMVERGSAG